jgi:hypothetical protein
VEAAAEGSTQRLCGRLPWRGRAMVQGAATRWTALCGKERASMHAAVPTTQVPQQEHLQSNHSHHEARLCATTECEGRLRRAGQRFSVLLAASSRISDDLTSSVMTLSVRRVLLAASSRISDDLTSSVMTLSVRRVLLASSFPALEPPSELKAATTLQPSRLLQSLPSLALSSPPPNRRPRARVSRASAIPRPLGR